MLSLCSVLMKGRVSQGQFHRGGSEASQPLTASFLTRRVWQRYTTGFPPAPLLLPSGSVGRSLLLLLLPPKGAPRVRLFALLRRFTRTCSHAEGRPQVYFEVFSSLLCFVKAATASPTQDRRQYVGYVCTA